MRTTNTIALAIILILGQLTFLLGEEVGKSTDKTRLQKALFAEEVERDLAKAAKEYELLVEEYTAARRVGVSALYRLAEVRRKQKRNEDASKLYLRIVSEFPDDPEARLSRENLIALGVQLPADASRIPDEPENPDETKELRRLTMLARNGSERVWNEVALDGNPKVCPLAKAAHHGWLRVMSFLLEEHKKSGADQNLLEWAFCYAIDAGQLKSCQLLAKHGVDPTESEYYLVWVIENHHQAVGDWLLKQGVGVNVIGQGEISSSTRGELTPLGAAIAADDPEWVDRLLELGADVNYQGSEPNSVSISPLSIACLKGHAKLVKRLLDLGADPNSADTWLVKAELMRKPASPAKGWRPLHYAVTNSEIVSLLLAAGADAKGADADGLTPLHVAAYMGEAASCKLLLKAGAASDPAVALPWFPGRAGFEGLKWTPLMLAVRGQYPYGSNEVEAQETIEILAAHGASLTPPMSAEKYRDIVDLVRNRSSLRRWLVEMVRYPEFARSNGITVSLPAASAIRILKELPGDDSSPPSLTELLLSWLEPIPLSDESKDQSFRMDRGFLRRDDGTGQFIKIPFEVLDVDSHPQLQWGDIIEFNLASRDAPANVISPPSSLWDSDDSVALAPQIYLKLLAKLELKVTIAWPDRPRQELTLRGGLRVYDPSRAEAPLVSPESLLNLLGVSELRTKHRWQITRSEKYGGAMVAPADSSRYSGIRFLDGDLLTVAPMDTQKAEEFRKVSIQLLEPESGFRWSLGAGFKPSQGLSGAGNDTIKPALHPTLLQFLAEFYLPIEASELQRFNEVINKEMDSQKWDPNEVKLAVWQSGMAPWATIRHPDLREIWIDRLGGERICVPLAELIAKTNEKTPREFYHQADIELKPGDIVEIRLLPDHEKERWQGFDPKTTQFIQKALNYDLKIVLEGEKQQSHHVQWSPPHWFETSAGPIALGKSEQKPFLMRVNETCSPLIDDFKWEFTEVFLRQGALIQKGKKNILRIQLHRPGSSYLLYRWIDGVSSMHKLLPKLKRPRTPATSSNARVRPSSNGRRRHRYVPNSSK